jgi:hypothetical protein
MHKGQKSSAKLLRKTVPWHKQTICKICKDPMPRCTHTQHNLKDTVIIIVVVIIIIIFQTKFSRETKQNVRFERENELSDPYSVVLLYWDLLCTSLSYTVHYLSRGDLVSDTDAEIDTLHVTHTLSHTHILVLCLSESGSKRLITYKMNDICTYTHNIYIYIYIYNSPREG